MNTYTELIDKHKGENCFIYGAGPSLFYNMQEPFFKELKNNGIVITVNSAIIAEEEPDFWISNDHLTVNWSWFVKVRNSKCIKVIRNSWLEYKQEFDEFYIFKPRETSEDVIDFEENALAYCCSVSSAIDFGIQCGCKKIFLLGLDHCEYKGRHHYWQFFSRKNQPRQLKPAQGPFSQQKSLFPIHLKAYKALKGFAEYRGCKIYNCNPDSLVEVFKKIKFKNIEEHLKEK